MVEKNESLKNSFLTSRKIYQKEQDELLQTILSKRFFEPWSQSGPANEFSDVPAGAVELFVTPSCNQNCEYCYLKKYEDELYPREKNNRDNILKNLRKVLNWISNNGYNVPNLDLFSGDIWHTSLGLEVLDTIYEYMESGKINIPFITLPTNAAFLRKEQWQNNFQERIDKLSSVGCRLLVSISVDGKIIEEKSRPLVSGVQGTDEFYDKVFLFAKKNGYGFHPMLSAKTAKYWKENFIWWMKQLRKYDLNISDLMLLEVRNNDWTEEDVADYEDFLEYLIDLTLKFYGDRMDMVVDDLFLLNQLYGRKYSKEEYLWTDEMPYMPFNISESKRTYGCTISSNLTIRLGDLAIAPCHRSAYNKYLYGRFSFDENGEILGVKATNPELAANILLLDSHATKPGCDSCLFTNYCLGTCVGQSIEACSDPLRNDPLVCENFLKKKYKAIFRIYEKKGIIKWLKDNVTENHASADSIFPLLKIYDELKREEDHENLAKLREDFYRDFE